jgi:hypothetical protein
MAQLKIIRTLQTEFPFAEVSITNGGHIRLQLPNGRLVFVSATPSDRAFMRHVRRNVKHQMMGGKNAPQHC